MFILWLFSFISAACPNLTCEALSTGVCITSTGSDTYQVNTTPCADTNQYCTYSQVQSWMSSASNGDSYSCQSSTSMDLSEPSDPSYIVCPSRDINRDLQTGSYPKQCQDDDDCRLQDGENQTCTCGIDGEKYCEADRASTVYDEYWRECFDNNGQLESLNHYNYWNLFYTNYVEYTSVNSCGLDMFDEFREITTSGYEYDAAVALVVTVWVIY